MQNKNEIENGPSVPIDIQELREDILTVFSDGINGTVTPIPDIEKSEKGRHRLEEVLGYTDNTRHHLRTIALTLMSPEEFDVYYKERRNGKDWELDRIEHGDVLTEHRKTKHDTLDFYTFPMRRIHGSYDLLNDANETLDLSRQEIFNIKEIIYRLTYIYGNPFSILYNNSTSAEQKRKDFDLFADGAFLPNSFDTMLAPYKKFLLNFYAYGAQQNPKELYKNLFQSLTESGFTSSIKDAKTVNGFDVLTVEMNKDENLIMTKKDLDGSRNPASKLRYEAEILRLESLKENPTVDIVGVGKIPIGDHWYYLYTGADQGGCKVKEPSRFSIASLIPRLQIPNLALPKPAPSASPF